MNEMIYGNTGKRDEGINIDMDQALYQKLQSRTFVPKLKSMLNDHLQEGDKNFVFIGEVADKSGNFSVYGYNAKLESDSRGGDYGHYVAVPVNDKYVTVDTDNVAFLTEEGFVEYVNVKKLNDEKRFKISPISVDIDINSKKRIVNNLMETFMRVRKRKNVTFSFDDCSVEEFTSKALFVLVDILKYLPYRMRKNVSFMSHIASNQKLPDMINLAAYPASSEFKPHDCIALNAGTALGNDSIFSEYVEKVFSMNDAEREEYFEKIHEDIEEPAIEKGIDVKADLYLLDVSTKELWTAGDINEALISIFNSVSDVLVVYPLYTELAKNRLVSNEAELIAYIQNRINEASTPEELKAVFDNLTNVYSATKLDITENIIEMFKAKANTFIEAASGDISIIDVTSAIVSIRTDVLDQKCARNKFRDNMGKKLDINSIYSFYLRIKEKNLIDAKELDICLSESLDDIILKETDKYSEAKDKLFALEKIYSEFQSACAAEDYSLVKEVYDVYRAKYNSGANAEAVDKGNNIVYEIDKELKGYCTFFDVKNCIIRLAGVEVSAQDELKQKASYIYSRLSKRLFDELRDDRIEYGDFQKLIEEISPAVKRLNENEVYDEQLTSGWGQEKFVANGMYRFVTVFESMIANIEKSDNLAEVLFEIESTKEQIKDESNLIKMFEKYAHSILANWLRKNKKSANKNAFKKAVKYINKQYDKSVSQTVSNMFDCCLANQNSCGSKKKPSVASIIIAGLVAVAIIAALVIGGILLFNKDKPTEQDNVTHDVVIMQDEVTAVEQYLAAFKVDAADKEAQLVSGTISKVTNENGDVVEDKFSVTVKNSLKSELTGTIEASKGEIHANSKWLFEVGDKADTVYAIVLQKDNEDETKTYIRDLFEIPQDLGKYDFATKYTSEKITEGSAEQSLYSNIIKYVGYKSELLNLETKNPVP